MKIVFVSHSFHSPYFVVGSHHLARQLARRGHTVWHISAIPLFHLLNPQRRDYKERFHRFFQGALQPEANLTEVVIRPLLPWQMTRAFLKFNNFFLKFSDIGNLTRSHPELSEADVLIIDEPRLSGIESYIRAPSIYYRPTDLYADTKNDPTIRETESALLGRCKGLIATSEPVLSGMLTLKPTVAHLLLTNGVDPDDFSAAQEEPAVLRNVARPRVVYVGAVDERLDIGAIQFLAKRFPDTSFVIVGDGSRYDEVRAIAGGNICVLGLVPHARLNSYLQYCDVGLLPLIKSRSNDGRSPLKIYEYGMAGLPVLASQTPELLRRKENFIELYSDYEEAAECLKAILSRARNRSEIVAQCADQSWAQKALILEKFIHQTQSLPA